MTQKGSLTVGRKVWWSGTSKTFGTGLVVNNGATEAEKTWGARAPHICIKLP